MKHDEFKKLTAQLLAELTPSQQKRLLQSFQSKSMQEESSRIVEKRMDAIPQCPHCNALKFVKFGFDKGLQRYRCKECCKTFNALTGTPLARLRHKEKWLTYSESIQKGDSLRTAATKCGVDLKTSFRWRHRFLALPESQQAKLLSGVAEADETFFLHSEKGSRNMSRKPRKRGGKAKKRGVSDEQVRVLVMRDRSGVTMDSIMKEFTADKLKEAVSSVLDKDIMLCTDGSPVYKAYAQNNNVAHKAINLSAGIRVRDKVFHIQNVNAYHRRLKGWMGRFNGVATKYLHNYLGWRRMLERENKELSPHSILFAALGIEDQRQIPT